MQNRVIALGFFDGIHLGHGALLSAVCTMAQAQSAVPAAMTFDTHPDALLTGTPVELLNTPADRALLMERLYGIREILTLHFDRETMALPWEVFAEAYLLRRYHACGVVCGTDFRFGAGGAGTAEKLAGFCESRGVACAVIPQVTVDGQTVSSTLLRELVAAGDLEKANRFLGHPHLLTGVVEHGQHLGRTMGIPTVNLSIPAGLVLPPCGVYASRVTVEGKPYNAVTNIGTHPTVGACSVPKAEAWLSDFDREIYGQRVELMLYARLRGERQFPSLEALAAEIRRNREQMEQYFATHGAD